MTLEYSLYDGFVTALAAMLLGCSFGIPALAFLSELAGIIRQKVFMDKFARQTARLGLLVIYAILISVVGAWLLCLYYPDYSGPWIRYELFWNFSLYLCLVAAGLFSLYYFLWNRLIKIKVLHLILGAMAAASMKMFLALLFWAIYRELMTIPELMPGPDSIFLPMLSQLFLISLSGAAAITLVYLLIRRNRDDFGRDYYRFALNFGAKWAMAFILLSPLTCIWLFLVMNGTVDLTYTAIPGGAYALGVIMIALLMWRIARSPQPLRNKAAIVLCPVLVWAVLVFRLASYLEFANMSSAETIVHTFVRNWPVLF